VEKREREREKEARETNVESSTSPSEGSKEERDPSWGERAETKS